ncbi:hypothetical protein H072_10931 [Dactylellina haptotyla CBS 200.50]|uniref:Uncharacterized protein n=1 Tax=Dactylellina haptotyla (strain CBS 200.50) TaxID=1284197 RepID=S8B987_DACHA|nr:hypothetical protein H072_10931 [Dactylellina haptotyla CBS 200.50]
MKLSFENNRNSIRGTIFLAVIGAARGLIIKVRHFDYDNGATYDLNLCRPLQNNRIILVQDVCEGDAMPGWRARFDSSTSGQPRSVVDLFGPPFSQGLSGAYEENRNFATWGGGLFYNQQPWKPLMFRTGYDQQEGYIWRLPFEIKRRGRPVVIDNSNPLAVGDVLELINVPDDTTMTLLEYSKLVSCDTPSGRVLRRTSVLGQAKGRLFTRKYHDVDCVDVELWVSDLGYTDPNYPIQAPFPLATIPEQTEVSSSAASSQQNLDESWSSSAYASSEANSLDGSIGGLDMSAGSIQSDLTGSISSSSEAEEDDPEWKQLVQDLEQEYGFSSDPIQDINLSDMEIQQQIDQYLASPEAANFDQTAIRTQLSSMDFGSAEELDDEIAKLEALLAEEM